MSQSHDSYENIDSEAESDSLNRMSPSLSLVSDLLRNWLKKTNSTQISGFIMGVNHSKVSCYTVPHVLFSTFETAGKLAPCIRRTSLRT
jgi:hypothetical protein